MQPQPQPTKPPYYPPSTQPKLLIVIVAVVVAIVLIVVGVLWAFVFSKGGEEEEYIPPVDGAPPTITLTHTGTVSWTGVSRVNVTWMISGVSRSDIKWTDIPTTTTGMKVLVGGASVTATLSKNAGGTYVTGGDTISANMTTTVCPTGSVVQLIIVYTPSGSTCGTVTSTVTY